MSYTNTFTQTILENSTSNIWEIAKTEWEHIGSHLQYESNCICGHSIHEVCTIQNTLNNITLEVGNVCVRKFMEIDRRSDFKLINKNLIDLNLFSELTDNQVLSEWEVNYYTNIKRKRKLTIRQLEVKYSIICKAQDYVMRNKNKKVGIIDPHVFKNLKQEMKQEHKELLGKHLIEIGYKLSKDKSGKTINDVMLDMKNILINLKKLKDTYER